MSMERKVVTDMLHRKKWAREDTRLVMSDYLAERGIHVRFSTHDVTKTFVTLMEAVSPEDRERIWDMLFPENVWKIKRLTASQRFNRAAESWVFSELNRLRNRKREFPFTRELRARLHRQSRREIMIMVFIIILKL